MTVQSALSGIAMSLFAPERTFAAKGPRQQRDWLLDNLRHGNTDQVRAALRTAQTSTSFSAPLNGCDLRGLDLQAMPLQNAALRNSTLAGANCRGSDLSHADLSGAEVAETDFRYAKLYDAKLSKARNIKKARGLIYDPPTGLILCDHEEKGIMVGHDAAWDEASALFAKWHQHIWQDPVWQNRDKDPVRDAMRSLVHSLSHAAHRSDFPAATATWKILKQRYGRFYPRMFINNSGQEPRLS